MFVCVSLCVGDVYENLSHVDFRKFGWGMSKAPDDKIFQILTFNRGIT